MTPNRARVPNRAPNVPRHSPSDRAPCPSPYRGGTSRHGANGTDNNDERAPQANCPACGDLLLWSGGVLVCCSRDCANYGKAARA